MIVKGIWKKLIRNWLKKCMINHKGKGRGKLH